MTEVKIFMDEYGLLYAILPDGSKRERSEQIYLEIRITGLCGWQKSRRRNEHERQLSQKAFQP